MPTTVEVLRGARRILEDGGDPTPCNFGQWCPYCCASIAKGDLDKRDGTELDTVSVCLDVIFGFQERPGDEPLLDATRFIGDAGARNAAMFTKESAIAFVNSAIAHAELAAK